MKGRGVMVAVVWELELESVVVRVGLRVMRPVEVHWTGMLVVEAALSESVTVRGQDSWVFAAI